MGNSGKTCYSLSILQSVTDIVIPFHRPSLAIRPAQSGRLTRLLCTRDLATKANDAVATTKTVDLYPLHALRLAVIVSNCAGTKRS